MNIKQGHIDGRQAIAFLWLAASGKVLLTIPGLLIAEGFSREEAFELVVWCQGRLLGQPRELDG